MRGSATLVLCSHLVLYKWTQIRITFDPDPDPHQTIKSDPNAESHQCETSDPYPNQSERDLRYIVLGFFL
jgi:hypothetical protein